MTTISPRAHLLRVLALNAAEADAATTIIANAVTVTDAAIIRKPARELDPDSDLRDLAVTVDVGPLSPEAVKAALGNGVALAQALLKDGLIEGALLALADEWRSVGGDRLTLAQPQSGRHSGRSEA